MTTDTTRWLGLGAGVGLLVGAALAATAGMAGASGLLVPTVDAGLGVRVLLHLLASAGVGAVVAWICRDLRGRTGAVCGAALAVAVVVWLLGPLSVVPLLTGSVPTWSVDAVTSEFPALIACSLVAVGSGLGVSLLTAPRAAGEWRQAPDAVGRATRIVVVGGGFGGTAVARRLIDRLGSDTAVEVTVLSDDTALLFTPMLAEVAGGALEPHHITAPLRAAVPGAVVRRGRVTAIDTDARRLTFAAAGGGTQAIAYDHVVLAVGAVPNLRGLPGLDRHAHTMKRLSDAVAVRRHVLAMLDRADTEPDAEVRARLLTFVVAGGGFAGTETAAELLDLTRSVRRFYPGLVDEEPRVVLVHSRDRILPEIGPRLADFALTRLRRRGIEFVLGARVAGATDDTVRLTVREEDTAAERVIPAGTLVWTAGNQPAPIVADSGLAGGRGGAVVVEPTLRVRGVDRVWAVGDCATVPVPEALRAREGDVYPPTAQHAIRQGRACADNVLASLAGAPVEPFRYRSQGTLVALGHRTAVAEVAGLRLSGFVAWLLWRSVYLGKLPGLDKKVRVALDWTLELFFPRDVATSDGPPVAADTLAPVDDTAPGDSTPPVAGATRSASVDGKAMR